MLLYVNRNNITSHCNGWFAERNSFVTLKLLLKKENEIVYVKKFSRRCSAASLAHQNHAIAIVTLPYCTFFFNLSFTFLHE